MMLLLLLLLSSFSCQAAASLGQGAVLQALYNSSWISTRLPTWEASPDPCGPLSWERVDCDAMGNVVSLNLSHCGLQGPIPTALGRLSSLRVLNLGNNKSCLEYCGPWNAVKGDLAAISSLTNLETLVLTSNELYPNSFPAAILKLTKLVNLRLDNCLIVGTIPVKIGSLINLQYLYLGNNSFSKPVPWKELSTLVSLSELSMWGNPLNTKCPPELGKLVNLTYLNLNRCNLFGGLPPEYGQLTKMKKIILYKNSLSGHFPKTWSSMNNLSELAITANSLFGEFPIWLLNVPSLAFFQGSVNYFYGSLQHPIVNKSTNPALLSISLECNYINGPRPIAANSTQASFDGNCFDGETNLLGDNATELSMCIRGYTCFDLYSLVRSGKCLDCPFGQHLKDKSNCICSQDHGARRKKMLYKVIIGCTIPVVGGIALVLIIISIYALRKLRKQSKLLKEIQKEFAKRDVQPSLYSYSELKLATQDFSKNQELGVGGYGVVYKGVLLDGSVVAIKQLKIKTEQALQDFLNEIATISSIKHRHLVQLKGCCIKGDERFLIYEFVENKNLAEALWDCAPNDKLHLDWPTRLKIIVGVGKGLLYLHEDVQPAIIHRDIKPPNILLDNNLNAKIADFGLALLFPELDDGQTHQSLTKVAGTRGYLAPEYATYGQISTKVDVYTYGILILEIVSGRKNIDLKKPTQEHYLFDWALKLHEVDQICNIVDVAILDSSTTKSDIKRVLNVAIWCLHHIPAKRPSISEALNILVNNEMEVSNISCKTGAHYDIKMDTMISIPEEESSLFHVHIDRSDTNTRD